MGNALAFLASLVLFLLCLILVKLVGAVFASAWTFAYIFMLINVVASALHWPFKRKLFDWIRFYLLINSVVMMALLVIQLVMAIFC